MAQVHTLATLPRHPESVPINALVPIRGTVLGDMLELGEQAGPLGLALAAAWALLRLKWGVVPVIAACALAGLARHLVNAMV